MFVEYFSNNLIVPKSEPTPWQSPCDQYSHCWHTCWLDYRIWYYVSLFIEHWYMQACSQTSIQGRDYSPILQVRKPMQNIVGKVPQLKYSIWIQTEVSLISQFWSALVRKSQFHILNDVALVSTVISLFKLTF